MKQILKFVITTIMVASFASCEKTQEQLLREMIETNIIENMNNPKSYEFVSISQADSIMSKWEDEEDAQKIKIFISMYEAENKALYAKADNPAFSYNKRISFVEKVGSNNKKIDSLGVEYIARKAEYVPHLTGYSIDFKFRGQNAFGAIVLNTYKVVLDETKTQIKEMKLAE